MAYILSQFDSLPIPIYLQDGDEQNMGTGSALSGFVPLPGGGFYDLYRNRKRPQGIRPITKSCLLWDDEEGDVAALAKAWRGKLGVRGKLSIQWEDGSIWWQWASLQDVNTPRPANAKGGWLPMELSWVTAAQWWYGVIQGEAWTWGDGSWVFGDGTAEYGQTVLTFDIDAATTVAIEHNGTIPARNIRIEIDYSSSFGNLQIRNRAAGQWMEMEDTGLSADSTLIIDCGSREIYEIDYVDDHPIAGIWREGNRLYINTGDSHSWATGNHIAIEGTEHYDGVYRSIVVLDANDLYVLVDGDTLPGYLETTGTVYEMHDRYGDSDFADKAHWLSLLPGDNELEVSFAVYTSGTATMRVRFYDHYA